MSTSTGVGSGTGIGILGIGTYLPEEVRTNDWWPASVVERWLAPTPPRAESAPQPEPTAGIKRVIREMEALKNDPFKGSVERRVLPKNMRPSDGELIAAKEALERAGIRASDVGVLLCSSVCPDYLTVPNAFFVHEKLGLSDTCFTTGIEAGCNGFLIQLQLAQALIAAGRAKYALLVQSSMLSRILPYDEPYSTYFGDGAAAVVVGAVGEGRGLVSQAHFADGSNCRGFITTVPGKDWYDDGRCTLHYGDKKTVVRMLLTVSDIGEQAMRSALTGAGIMPEQVDFFACHAGGPWFGKVVQEASGMTRARTLNTFPWTSSLTAANLPFTLHVAEKEGLVRDGDCVALFASGIGSTWSGAVMRWGR